MYVMGGIDAELGGVAFDYSSYPSVLFLFSSPHLNLHIPVQESSQYGHRNPHLYS